MRLSYLRNLAATSVLLFAAPAWAAPDTEEFFLKMAKLAETVPAPNDAQGIGIGSNGKVDADYFQFVVKRTSEWNLGNINDMKGNCDAALKPYHGGALQRLVFGTKTELRSSFRLILAEGDPVLNTDPVKVELNLIGLSSSGNKKCRTAKTIFDRNGASWEYVSPLVAMDQSLAKPVAKIEFVPWLEVKQDEGRVSNFWDGLGAFVGILGPIGSILGTMANDKFEFRDEVTSMREFDFVKDRTQAPDALEIKTLELDLQPAIAGQGGVPGTALHRPRMAKFGWGLNMNPRPIGADPLKPDHLFEFTVQVRYLPSLVDTLSVSASPLSQWDVSEFRNLLITPTHEYLRIAGNPDWKAMSDAMKNLDQQKEPATFNAACTPTLADLQARGLSLKDRALIVFAMAKSNLKADAIRKVGCFSTHGKIRNALNDMGLKLGVMPTEKTEREDFLKVAHKAFAAPGKTDDFSKTVEFPLKTGGNPGLLRLKDGQPFPTEISNPEGLKAAFAKLTPTDGEKKCFYAGRSPEALQVFPGASGMGEALDQIVAQIFRTADNKALVILYGLNGMGGNDRAVFSQMWIGDAFAEGSDTLRAIRDAVAADTNCNAVFKPLVSPPITPTAQTPPPDNNPQ